MPGVDAGLKSERQRISIVLSDENLQRAFSRKSLLLVRPLFLLVLEKAQKQNGLLCVSIRQPCHARRHALKVFRCDQRSHDCKERPHPQLTIYYEIWQLLCSKYRVIIRLWKQIKVSTLE